MSFFTKHKQAIYVTLYFGLLGGVAWLYVTTFIFPDQTAEWFYMPDNITVIKMNSVFENPDMQIDVASYDDPLERGGKRTALMHIYSEGEVTEEDPLVVYEGFSTWCYGYSISVLNVTSNDVSVVIEKVE